MQVSIIGAWQVASGGLNRAWKIFTATPKHSHEGTPTTVSIWLLDKKALLLDNRQAFIVGARCMEYGVLDKAISAG